MPEAYKVSPIVGKAEVTVDDFNRLVVELNKMLSEISVAISKASGHGAVSSFGDDIDLDGHNINNVGKVNFFARKHVSGDKPFSGEYAIDDPTATANVTALRDDIIDNVLPDIETALNDVGKNLKRLLDVLKV
jgi:hypothetical protein